MTTIRDIAELAGVSRGTVDRVLNNRGSVNEKTAEKVRAIAEALDYHPNRAGMALAAQKKKYKIGVILFSESNPYFDQVMEGVRAKAAELAEYGIATSARRVEFDTEAQLAAIRELREEGIHGLMLAPYNDPRIREEIDRLSEAGIPAVTVNTDIEGSRRIAYVGSDYYAGGRVAAGLLSLMTEGEVPLGVITGSPHVLCHTERVRGLRETLAVSCPRIRIANIRENHDDEITSYNETRSLLREHPEIRALFFAAAGVAGGCRAAEESGRPLKIVTFDEVPSTVALLKRGVISATISQQPRRQGARSLEILFDALTTGELPEAPEQFVEHAIRIRENIQPD